VSTVSADQEIAPYNAAIVHRPEAVAAAATAAETNINFLGVPPGHPRYATGWAPATRDRLAAVRAHYDPRGLLLDPGPSAE
jgi:hypothetical protein